MWINHLILPIIKDGATPDGSIACQGVTQMGYVSFSQNVVYGGGFMLTGIANDTMWANAVASASRVKDYIPGRVLSTPQDTAGVYVIDRNDPPFGPSWQEWRKAVRLGADFYDGDNDSVYNPVDLNNNGLWDPNEDAPDLLGDQTAWLVINDGVPAGSRRWNLVTPKGIDIQITVFGYRSAAAVGDILFLRYRIINRGTVAQAMDSVYFSAWADADVLNYENDLVGCDTSRHAGYTWSAPTIEWLTYMASFLQGPVAYIPGVTFIDLNANGEYDPGEPALDTARTAHGPLLGRKVYPGATNLGISSFVNYVSSDPVRGDPGNHLQARSYMLGRMRDGSVLNPCADPYGAVFGQPCTGINPRYWYSGNPDTLVSGYGWIYTSPSDVRQMLNTGPFKLRQNRALDIIVSYVVGSGTHNRNSVTAARHVTDLARTIYQGNFGPVTSAHEETFLPKHFLLGQNYPNPFNPTTTIQFSIPTRSTTVLKVFDVLGREIATLLNEPKQPGIHTVHWDASAFPSGIYFYRLQTNDFVKTKKMILVK